MEKGWTLVYSTGNLQRAELIKAMLQENGIEAVVLNKQDSSYAFGDVEVYVTEENQLKANHLIKSNTDE